MLGRLATFTVLLSTLLTCTSARAALSVFWHNNSITPQAIANDPALSDMQSWSLMVNNDEGSFSTAGLRATLPSGNRFYRNALGGFSRPAAPEIASNPALEFHTYVTSPHDGGGGSNAPSVFGPFPVNQPPQSFGGPNDPLPGVFSTSWGHPTQPVIQPPGTFEIVRLTFPKFGEPLIDPESYAAYIAPNQTILLPARIPEPGAMVVVAILPLLARRSTRRPRSLMEF
jgi:hypothetical protein